MNDWNAQMIEEFRSNNGMTEMFGDQLVIMHCIGAKSGTERLNPVKGIRQPDGSWHVAASKAGADTNPDWLANLKANPDIDLEVANDGAVVTVPVTAQVLTGAERDSGWAEFAQNPGFAAYEKKTTRVIPVVKLAPRAA